MSIDEDAIKNQLYSSEAIEDATTTNSGAKTRAHFRTASRFLLFLLLILIIVSITSIVIVSLVPCDYWTVLFIGIGG